MFEGEQVYSYIVAHILLIKYIEMTKPVAEVLAREVDQPEVAKLLETFSRGLEEYVNFGTHILNWDIKNSKGRDENLPVFLLFRQIIEFVDAISVMVKHSSIEPCKALLRSVLETALELEYILEKDSKTRALSFLLWHLHYDLNNNMKGIENTPEHQEHIAKLRSGKIASKYFNPMKIQGLEDHNLEISKQINSPLFTEIEKEYQRLQKKNPKWYELYNGPKNIEQLANRLGRRDLYEILYRYWSGTTHGTDILHGKLRRTKEGETMIVSIRFPAMAQMVTVYSLNLCVWMFSLVIRKRLPNHKNEFRKWYARNRPFHLKLTKEELLHVIDE